MAIISIFSGSHCSADEVAGELASLTGYRLIDDDDVVAISSRLSGVSPDKIRRAFSAKTSIFNEFNHEKEASIAFLKLALARLLKDDESIVTGYGSLLIPSEVKHVLRVCLIADLAYRTARALEAARLSAAAAAKEIQQQDEDSCAWVRNLTGRADPWDAALYDMLIPMDKRRPAAAAAAVFENLANKAIQPTASSRQIVDDFRLSAEVEVALAGEGHHVSVAAKGGRVTLTIVKPVLMLTRLEEELKDIAGKVGGVESVTTVAEKNVHQYRVYRKRDFSMPSRVLLVDDEREFVETLSERLQIRDMGAAVTFDGRSALDLIDDENPEVMIIDLKMPGIDGIEVLKKVKATRPEIEVIIMTGHGSETDRETCMQLGAFAYLQKPLDIDELSEILKEAHTRTRGR
jgi:CheY-like chemotaxis protein